MRRTEGGKTCPKCQVFKVWDDFHRNRARRDGRAIWCKPCIAAYSKGYNQRPNVKKRAAASALARYHQLSSNEKLRLQERRKEQGAWLKRKYGLTVEDYERMLAEQKGGCAICGNPPKPNRRLAVDHDHACCPSDHTCGNCIRGLLCTACNVWLGFYENKTWVDRADRYLQREIANRERALLDTDSAE